MCDHLTPAQAQRRLTTLKRQRASRTLTGPCTRCGGAGGYSGWPGFTCYRCGGQNSRHFEVWVERYWPTPELEAQAEALEAIIAADRAEKARAAAAAALAVQIERDHEAALQEDAWRAERALKPWVGTVGERRTFDSTVLYATKIDGYYGASMLVLFRDEATGATLKTFGTGDGLWGLQKMDRVELTATVKEHETYKGEKVTIITRVKVARVESVAPAV